MKDVKKKNPSKHFGWDRLFYNNKFAIAFSVFLALVLWAIMVSSDTQDRPKAITGVPVKVVLSDSAQADGVKVFKQSDNTATVYVKGNSMIVGQLKASDIECVATLPATVTAQGSYPLSLQVQNVGQNFGANQYTVDSIVPQQIYVSVDRYREKTFPIVDDISYAEGYQSDPSYFVGAPTLSSDNVTISGPEKQVSQINKVTYEYKVTKTLTDTVHFTADLVLYDANGNKLGNGDMTINPEKVDVTIPVLPRQTVALEPTFANKPSGLTLSSGKIAISPSTIEIAGPKDTLAELGGKLSLDTINFAEISPSHNTFDVDLTLPKSCKNLSNQPSARITLNLEGMSTRLMTASLFGVKNLGTDKTASITSDGISVTVVGPPLEVAKLSNSSLVGSVDLSSTGNFTGQTEVPVTFTVSGSTSCWVYGSYMITVNISQKNSD